MIREKNIDIFIKRLICCLATLTHGEVPLYGKLGVLAEFLRIGHSQRGPGVLQPGLQGPGHSQHVCDHTHAPHVRGEGHEVVVHHFGSQELRSPKIHLQLLTGFVPAPGEEPRVRSWESFPQGRARHSFWERGRGAELSAGSQGSSGVASGEYSIIVPLPEQSQEEEQGHYTLQRAPPKIGSSFTKEW